MPRYVITSRRPSQHHSSRSTPQAEHNQFDEIHIIGRGSQGDCWLMRAFREDRLVVRKVLDEYPMIRETPLEVRILNEILPRHHSIPPHLLLEFQRPQTGAVLQLLCWKKPGPPCPQSRPRITLRGLHMACLCPAC